MQTLPCGIELSTFEVCMWIGVNLNSATVLWVISPSCAIKTKFLDLWEFGRFGYFSLIAVLRLMNHCIQLSRLPFLKQSDVGVVSTKWCLLCSTLLYSRIHRNPKQEILSLAWCQKNDVFFEVHYSTQKYVHISKKNMLVHESDTIQK